MDYYIKELKLGDIGKTLNSINDYNEIRPTLESIFNDLRNIDIVHRFLSKEWNKRGYKYIKDNNNKKIKCKTIDKNSDLYKVIKIKNEREDPFHEPFELFKVYEI